MKIEFVKYAMRELNLKTTSSFSALYILKKDDFSFLSKKFPFFGLTAYHSPFLWGLIFCTIILKNFKILLINILVDWV